MVRPPAWLRAEWCRHLPELESRWLDRQRRTDTFLATMTQTRGTGQKKKRQIMNLITTTEHAYATAAKDIVTAAKFVQTNVLPVLSKAQTQASTIEAVTGLVSPAAVNIERAAFAVLGVIV